MDSQAGLQQPEGSLPALHNAEERFDFAHVSADQNIELYGARRRFTDRISLSEPLAGCGIYRQRPNEALAGLLERLMSTGGRAIVDSGHWLLASFGPVPPGHGCG